MKYTREQIKARLQEPVDTNITFTKVNGEVRHIRCTTNLDAIPQESRPVGTERYLNPDVIRVFDLDLNEWRSFRYTSVTDMR